MGPNLEDAPAGFHLDEGLKTNQKRMGKVCFLGVANVARASQRAVDSGRDRDLIRRVWGYSEWREEEIYTAIAGHPSLADAEDFPRVGPTGKERDM